TNDVAELVNVKPGDGRRKDDVALAELNLPKRNAPGIFFSMILKRHELEEGSAVRNDPHAGLTREIARRVDSAFCRVVRVDERDIIAPAQRANHRQIRIRGDAPPHEQIEVWPDLADRLNVASRALCDLKHPLE